MKKIPLIIFILVLLAPFTASASAPLGFTPNLNGPLISCSGTGPGGSDKKECQSVCDFLSTFKNFIDLVLSYFIFIIAPALFLWGGFRILTGGGSPASISAGWSVVRRTIYAVLIIVVSYTALNVFIHLVGIQDGYIHGFNDEISCTPNL